MIEPRSDTIAPLAVDEQPAAFVQCRRCKTSRALIEVKQAGAFAFPIYADCECPANDELAARKREERDARDEQIARVRSIAMLNPMPKRLQHADWATLARDDNNRAGILRAGDFMLRLSENPTGEFVSAFALFSKNVGTGKTWIAAAVVNELRKNALGAMMYTVTDAMDAIRATFGDTERHERLTHELREAPVLVLDDLGKEYAKADSWAATEFYTVVNARWNNALPIVVTSNFSPVELRQARYAAGNEVAIMDRLLGMIDSKSWIPLGGDSRRW